MAILIGSKIVIFIKSSISVNVIYLSTSITAAGILIPNKISLITTSGSWVISNCIQSAVRTTEAITHKIAV